MNRLKYVFVNFIKKYQNCIFFFKSLWQVITMYVIYDRKIIWRKPKNRERNESIKIYFYFFNFESKLYFPFWKKKIQSGLRQIFLFLKWNFQNSIFIFRFIRIHQNCIFFRYLFSFLHNRTKKINACFSSSNPNCILIFLKFALEMFDSFDWKIFSKQDFTTQVCFVYFKNETFKIQFSYFQFSRIYQDCIFFLYFSKFF